MSVRRAVGADTRSRVAAARALLSAAVLACAVSFGRPAEVGAQDRRGPPDRAQLEQRIRAQMGRMMRERLALDEDQAAALAGVVQDFDGRRRELFQQEQATRRRVEALLLEGSGDQAEARDLMDRMSELRIQEAALFAAEQEALLAVLTPVQVLQLQELREDLGQRIRALRGDRDGPGPDRERRPRGPGPGAFRDGPGGPPQGPGGAASDRVPLG